MFSQSGYINPNLDILHLAVPFAKGAEGHIHIEDLSPATLRVTLDRDLDPSSILKWLVDLKPDLLRGVKTIDFWLVTPSLILTRKVTERYRICRAPPSTPRTPVVTRRNIVYLPAALDHQCCPDPECQTPTWVWRYSPEASYPVTSTGPDYHAQQYFQRGHEIAAPNPDGPAVVIPSINFDWKATRARALLQETNVLLFDPGDGVTTREWVMCKVVDSFETRNELVIHLGV